MDCRKHWNRIAAWPIEYRFFDSTYWSSKGSALVYKHDVWYSNDIAILYRRLMKFENLDENSITNFTNFQLNISQWYSNYTFIINNYWSYETTKYKIIKLQYYHFTNTRIFYYNYYWNIVGCRSARMVTFFYCWFLSYPQIFTPLQPT